MPLYRQEKQLRRSGIDLPRATMARWVIKACMAIQPLINLLNEQMLSGHYIGMDETTIQVLNELGLKAQSKSYPWVRRGGPPDHPIVLYDYDPSRSQALPVRLLDGHKVKRQQEAVSLFNNLRERLDAHRPLVPSNQHLARRRTICIDNGGTDSVCRAW